MKVTVKSALEMLQAVNQLDSYQNGGASPTLYKYAGDTRLRLAIAKRKLRAIQEDYIEARNAAVMELSNGSGALPADDMALNIKFANMDKASLKLEIDLDIHPLSVADLNLDENPIPAGVLDLLGELVAT